MRYVMICSKPECDFSKSNTESEGIEKFCPTCGSELMWLCPHCDHPLRNKGAVHCSECGKRLKPRPSQEGP